MGREGDSTLGASGDGIRIPLAQPDISDAEVQAVVEVLHSGVLSIGERLSEFERAVAGLIGAAHAVGVSSGTAALHL